MGKDTVVGRITVNRERTAPMIVSYLPAAVSIRRRRTCAHQESLLEKAQKSLGSGCPFKLLRNNTDHTYYEGFSFCIRFMKRRGESLSEYGTVSKECPSGMAVIGSALENQSKKP